MAKAIWNGVVLAESPHTEMVEGNHYFPPNSLNREYFKESSHHTTCPWKGVASYYTIEVNGQKNENAAWFYPTPKAAAHNIKNHVAFWRGVQVQN
ncbi:MAG: DUF427 domain-containing protein [Anaerolineales bacterium]|nr:DUF427 domain-containing protein [Anaerolineales bacterium]